MSSGGFSADGLRVLVRAVRSDGAGGSCEGVLHIPVHDLVAPWIKIEDSGIVSTDLDGWMVGRSIVGERAGSTVTARQASEAVRLALASGLEDLPWERRVWVRGVLAFLAAAGEVRLVLPEIQADADGEEEASSLVWLSADPIFSANGKAHVRYALHRGDDLDGMPIINDRTSVSFAPLRHAIECISVAIGRIEAGMRNERGSVRGVVIPFTPRR